MVVSVCSARSAALRPTSAASVALRAISEIETPISCAPAAAAETLVLISSAAPWAPCAWSRLREARSASPSATVATPAAESRPRGRSGRCPDGAGHLVDEAVEGARELADLVGAGVVHALGQVALAVGDLGHAVAQVEQRLGEPATDPVGEGAAEDGDQDGGDHQGDDHRRPAVGEGVHRSGEVTVPGDGGDAQSTARST